MRTLVPFTRGSDVARRRGIDPFDDMRRDMDRLLDQFSRGWDVPSDAANTGFLAPKVNVSETEKGLELTADLPGIDEKDIELDLTDGILTLKAEHQEEKEGKDEKKHYHLVERSYGTYMRRFALPFEPETDKVTAEFDKGVLKVFVPKPAETPKKATKIAVKGR
jgi:HSP20 family protein